MTPHEWRDAPDWERDLLIRGLNEELGGGEDRREQGGKRDGDGQLNRPPDSLQRLL